MGFVHSGARRGYTLIEVLVVVVVLGIATALVVPALGSTDVLRVQAAVRAVIAEVAVAQSEAVAMQQGRAVVFDVDAATITTVSVPGTTIDVNLNRLNTERISGGDYGDARIGAARFANNSTTLIFDEMGSPVTAAGGTTPAGTGSVWVQGSRECYRVDVQGYTGRMTVTRTDLNAWNQ